MNTSFENQALRESLSLKSKYVVDHVTTSLTPEHAMEIGCARYQFALEAARERLSWLFSVGELLVLIDCYRGYIFTPVRFSTMASDLCDHLDIDFSDYKLSMHKALIEKVHELELLLKIALADALEQLWRTGKKSQYEIVQFLRTLGIRLF
ncbi:hypothetical protein [Rhodoferax ferrireducens]|uniref:hypothetical protein n=1 Tax=Rhodoferax ferrireducens TaxID=192843 RepID=UPI0013005757|nr:hypothetical protein [Rhodoferax ferrireducens]